MTFGEKLKQCRIEKNFTQEQLAEQFQVTRQTVSKWELNQVMPEMKKLVEIAEYFDFSLDEMLLGQKPDEKMEEKVPIRKMLFRSFRLLLKNSFHLLKKAFVIDFLTFLFYYGFWEGAVHYSLGNLMDGSFLIIFVVGLGVMFSSSAFLENEEKQKKTASFCAILTGFIISVYYFIISIHMHQLGEMIGINLLPSYYGILFAFILRVKAVKKDTYHEKINFKWNLIDTYEIAEDKNVSGRS